MTFNGTAAKGSILKEERETASENWEKEHWGVITQLGAVLKEVVIWLGESGGTWDFSIGEQTKPSVPWNTVIAEIK